MEKANSPPSALFRLEDAPGPIREFRISTVGLNQPPAFHVLFSLCLVTLPPPRPIVGDAVGDISSYMQRRRRRQ